MSDRHPLWTQLQLPHTNIERFRAPRLSLIIIAALGQLAANVENLRSRNVFERSLDRLLLVCLRTKLAPKREHITWN